MTPDEAMFRAALLDPAQPVPSGLVDPDNHPAGKRFDVHRNTVVVSLSEALADGFPAVRRIVGAHNFGVLAGVFVRRHPPRSPVLAAYGTRMPAFLAGFAPVAHLGYLPDVARLELALRQAYHAADARPVAAETLQALPGPRLLRRRLALAPAVRLIQSAWPIVAIWRFNMADGPKPRMQPETALITRPGLDPMVTALDPAAAAFVAALVAGRPLAQALGAAQAVDAAFDPTPVLGALAAGGAITDLEEA